LLSISASCPGSLLSDEALTAASWIVSAPVSGEAGFKSPLSKDVEYGPQQMIYRVLTKLFETEFYETYSKSNAFYDIY
jgi:hypothetical protein